VELVEYRTLGRSGLRVSPLALGTMTFGDANWGSDAETSKEIIARYLDAGGNVIDTANGYSEGGSEQVIGEYLASRPGLRDRVVISTKYARNMYAGDPNGGGASRKAILEQVDASLRRLGVDYIDLYWQHCLDRHTPIEESIATLNDLVRDGKIRYIGISNTPAWAVSRIATIAELRGWAPVVALQVEYSLVRRTVEGELFGFAAELGLGVMPYSPLASGVLSGKYSRDNRTPEGSGRGPLAQAQLDGTNAFDVLDVSRELAKTLDVSVAAVALAWVRQQTPVTSTLMGARTVVQLEANLESLRVTIPQEGLRKLAEVSAPDLNYPFAWLASIAVPLTQSGTQINGVGSASYRRRV
jgi:aryl-alcohol dehydrogenase-like predicted oxidoreductase